MHIINARVLTHPGDTTEGPDRKDNTEYLESRENNSKFDMTSGIMPNSSSQQQ